MTRLLASAVLALVLTMGTAPLTPPSSSSAVAVAGAGAVADDAGRRPVLSVSPADPMTGERVQVRTRIGTASVPAGATAADAQRALGHRLVRAHQSLRQGRVRLPGPSRPGAPRGRTCPPSRWSSPGAGRHQCEESASHDTIRDHGVATGGPRDSWISEWWPRTPVPVVAPSSRCAGRTDPGAASCSPVPRSSPTFSPDRWGGRSRRPRRQAGPRAPRRVRRRAGGELTGPLAAACGDRGCDARQCRGGALACNPSGTVDKVRFFADGVLLAEVAQAPWQVAWTPDPGRHDVMARALRSRREPPRCRADGRGAERPDRCRLRRGRGLRPRAGAIRSRTADQCCERSVRHGAGDGEGGGGQGGGAVGGRLGAAARGARPPRRGVRRRRPQA